ncbi:MAG: hypothetical protein JW889_12935 [Verrucomicrobia bacterium]|nr:hypothetical protein [Verrucomicrobiota bacterium]
MSALIVSFLAAAVTFQVWVTWRVWRSELFQKNQKVAQSQLIWILPVLGAIIVHSVLSEEDKHDRSNGSGTGTLMS